MNEIAEPDTLDDAQFIGLIYDTSLDPALWPSLIDSISEMLESEPGNGLLSVDGRSTKNSLDRITPHLRRAIQLKGNYSNLENENKAFSHIIDNIPVGLFFTDLNQKVTVSNKLANELLQQGDVISLTDNALCLLDSLHNETFHGLFDKIKEANNNLKSEYYSLNIQTTSQSLSILVTNCFNTHDNHLGDNPVAVLVAPSKLKRQIDEKALSAIFNLTLAESKLARRLANGLSIEEIADKYYLSKHTLRTQLKSIFFKTDTTRQPELVKLILTSPAAFSRSEMTVPAPTKSSQKTLDFQAPRLNQTIQLKDGRVLGYAEYGPANGKPVFLFHSNLGCRFEKMSDDTVLEKNNIRLIIPERPGFGLSTYNSNMAYTAWPDNFEQLTEHLNVTSYSIIGFSMGARYALACAIRKNPALRNIVLLSAFSPYRNFSDLNGMSAHEKLLISIARYAPNFIITFMKKKYEKLLTGKESFFKEFKTFFMPSERKTIEKLNIETLLNAIMYEALKNGTDVLVKELQNWFDSLGGELSSIDIPVEIWHGISDQHAPIHMAKTLQAELSNVKQVYFIPGNHMLLFEKWNEILASAVK